MSPADVREVLAAFATGRYEGRREGFLEAASIMRTAGEALDQDGAPVCRAAAECLRQVAQQIEAAVARAVKP